MSKLLPTKKDKVKLVLTSLFLLSGCFYFALSSTPSVQTYTLKVALEILVVGTVTSFIGLSIVDSWRNPKAIKPSQSEFLSKFFLLLFIVVEVVLVFFVASRVVYLIKGVPLTTASQVCSFRELCRRTGRRSCTYYIATEKGELTSSLSDYTYLISLYHEVTGTCTPIPETLIYDPEIRSLVEVIVD